MKNRGIMRQLDSAGRIVIPKEFREMIGAENSTDKFEIFLQDDSIILKKFQPTCIFCNNFARVIEYEGHCVCESCVEKMKKMVEAQQTERQNKPEETDI